MHKLLERQLTRHLGAERPDELTQHLESFLAAVDEAYQAADEDRVLLERSLDLTSKELLKRNQELARSNEELEQFAYIVSHDLQEPLRAIAGYSQLLARRYQDRLDPEATDIIEGILAGSRRMQQMIVTLLEYARLDAGPKKVEPMVCARALEDALGNLSRAISESKAEVTHGELPEIWASPQQLALVFQNLIGNAIKFRGADPPRIHVFAAEEPSEWTISVEDNGIGIPGEHRKRIFLLFQRLHERGKYPGDGVGLAVCEKIIHRRGGRIWVEAHPGGGSVFRFTIPKPIPAKERTEGE
jgi:two-component system, chemotaxis family, sensor kinase Cph1